MGTINFNDKYFTNYEILGELGRSNARVLKAKNKTTGKIVAIKYYSFNIDTRILKLFQRESEIVTSIKHHNIVKVLEVNLDAEVPYIVMEYIEGGDLKSLIEKNKKLDVNTVILLGIQMANALAVIHSNNIIHRDIKPENIMYRQMENGEFFFLLSDFGISKIKGKQVSHTAHGSMTPEYASPEQLDLPLELDFATDFYSLGVVLYECLTGRVPYELKEGMGMRTFANLVCGESSYPKILGSSGDFQYILDELLIKNPSKRLKNAETLRTAFLKELHKMNIRKYKEAANSTIKYYKEGEFSKCVDILKQYSDKEYNEAKYYFDKLFEEKIYNQRLIPLTIESSDDLSIIEGIDPTIAILLFKSQIWNFKTLASTPVYKIEKKLVAAGTQFAHHDPSTWAQQAKLAAEGRWEDLEALKDFLVRGKEPEKNEEVKIIESNKNEEPKTDELDIIEGIGPKIAMLLFDSGIFTFRDLATTPIYKIEKILETAGPQFARHDPSTWTQQVKLASEGRWEDLEALKDFLVRGKEPEKIEEVKIFESNKYDDTKTDELDVIEGIGPKIAMLLFDSGIFTFRDLASTPIYKIEEILEAAGPQFARHDPSTWTQQAKLAAEGRWEDLQALKGFLVRGKGSEKVEEIPAPIVELPIEYISHVVEEKTPEIITPAFVSVGEEIIMPPVAVAEIPVIENNLDSITEEMLEKVNKVKAAIRKAMVEKNDKLITEQKVIFEPPKIKDSPPAGSFFDQF